MKSKMDDLRSQRIKAEITDLQTRLRNYGYELGGDLDWDTTPAEHREWIKRIWYLGLATHDNSIKV